MNNLQEKNTKYYTPNIEDLYVGYECKHTSNPTAFIGNMSDDIIYDKLYLLDLIKYLSWVLVDGKELNKFIKTPYLTKEQIIDEGWEYYNGKMFNSTPYFKKGHYTFRKGEGNLLHFSLEEFSNFTIACPSINEFRKIIKLLNI